jgi:hypothetical protein
MKNNQYVLILWESQNFDGKKTYTIVPEDEEISISSFKKKDDNAITPSKC